MTTGRPRWVALLGALAALLHGVGGGVAYPAGSAAESPAPAGGWRAVGCPPRLPLQLRAWCGAPSAAVCPLRGGGMRGLLDPGPADYLEEAGAAPDVSDAPEPSTDEGPGGDLMGLGIDAGASEVESQEEREAAEDMRLREKLPGYDAEVRCCRGPRLPPRHAGCPVHHSVRR
jgi:hypothetical protein